MDDKAVNAKQGVLPRKSLKIEIGGNSEQDYRLFMVGEIALTRTQRREWRVTQNPAGRRTASTIPDFQPNVIRYLDQKV